MGLSIVPDLCETMRRHGDNRIVFSGLAWRFRGKAVDDEKPTKAEGKEAEKEHKKNFKSFVLVVTNCAVYMLTKGGYEITRRTDLKSIEKITLSTTDPDAVLLSIPLEFDFFCRVEGRAQELVDRIQEARAEWSDFGLYANHETKGSHQIALFTFPVEHAADLVALGNLEKPKGFDEAQGHREAGHIKNSYIRELALSIERALQGPSPAPGRRKPGKDGAGSDAPTTMTVQETWDDEIRRSEDRVERIRFYLSRAYRFGYRAASIRIMSPAQAEVEAFRQKKRYAEKLGAALANEDVAAYDQIWAQCRHLPGMDLFQRRQREVLGALRERQTLERRIVLNIDFGADDEAAEATPLVAPSPLSALPSQAFFAPQGSAFEDDEAGGEPNLNFDDSDAERSDSTGKQGGPKRNDPKRRTPSAGGTPSKPLLPTSDEIDADSTIEDRLPTLALLFDAALKAGVKPERLSEYRLRLDRRLQQYRLTAYLNSCRAKGTKLDSRTKELLREAAHSLEVDARVVGSIVETEPPLVQWACKLLEAAADSGNAKTLSDAIARVKESGVIDQPQAAAALTAATQELLELQHHSALIEDLTALCGQLRTGLSRMSDEELGKALVDLQRFAAATSGARSLRTRSSLARMYEKKVRDALAVRQAEAARAEKARQDRLDYQARIAQAELDQQRAVREQQEEEQRLQHHRRQEQVSLWRDKTTRSRLQLDGYMRHGDVVSAQIVRQTCDELSREVLELHGHYPEEDQRHFAPLVKEISESLAETARRAAKYVDSKNARAAAESGQSPNAASGEAKWTMPEDLREAIQRQDKVKVVAYVQAHQGQLNVTAIDQIRSLWKTAAVAGQWITKLHSHLHTAVALGSIELLQTHLEAAKAHNFSDGVVRDSAIILERMKRDAAERAKEEAQRASQLSQDGNSPSAPRVELRASTIPEPAIPPLPQEGCNNAARGLAIKALHAATCRLLMEREKASAGKRDPKKLSLPAESPAVRSYVDAWLAVLMHRSKPVGLFKKVDRTFQDVLQVVTNGCLRGVKTAPETAALVLHFDTAKKYNNPNGMNASQLFVRYCLHKGQFAAVVREWGCIPPSDLENLYFDDSVHRAGAALQHVWQALLQSVLQQVEWQFEFVEGEELSAGNSANGSLHRAPSLSGSLSPLRAASSPGGNSSSPVFSSNRGLDNPIPIVRRAVGALTEYFKRESTRLGQRYSPSELRRLFDENHTKAVGLVVREHLCVAIHHVMLSGFRPAGMLLKRHPWEFLVASAERLKVSTRGIGGVGVPDAVDLVLQLTDPESARRNGADFSKMPQEQLLDIRMRMFYCHALSQQALAMFLEAIFDDTPSAEPFLSKWYTVGKCAMLIPPQRKEILRVFRKLSAMPFNLNVDAEIW